MIKIVFASLLSVLFMGQSPDLEKHYSNPVWDVLLYDVSMRYRYRVEYNSFVPVPRFGQKLEEMEGKEIVLRGFFLPADVTGEAFVLSYVPMKMCFFCAGAGIESVVELGSVVSHRMRFRRLQTDDFIEVKGVLRLNRDQPEHLLYYLEDTQLIKVY